MGEEEDEAGRGYVWENIWFGEVVPGMLVEDDVEVPGVEWLALVLGVAEEAMRRFGKGRMGRVAMSEAGRGYSNRD